MLWAFLPIAVLVTITPGAATANAIRGALRGGRRSGVLAIAGNSVGVAVWGLLSVLGISALVAASEVAFLVLKIGGAVVLVLIVAPIVILDFAWYTTLAVLVSRARRAHTGSRLARRLERATAPC
jgi:threonine/homoserine/homoserine lactone efflux protein